MTTPFQTRTRLQIRESIGFALNDMILISASSSVDTTSLIAVYSLFKGGDDEYNGRQVVCVTPAGSIVAAEKSWVSDFNATTKDATVSPAFTANIIVNDLFEMWKVFTVEEVNDAINQAIMDVTKDTLQIKQLTSQYVDSNEYEYNALSDFVGLYQVEYAYSVGTEHTLDTCDSVWTAGSANVTVTADTAFKKLGTASMKAVEDGGSGTNAKLCYKTISSTDLDDCDKVEFWMYSSIALTAGQLQIKLDDTAAIASALEAISIPAMSANTWYRHVLSLANPHTDVDIISIGIFQVADVGAFTFYVDDVRANLSTSKDYRILNPDYWRVIKDTTPYLKLTSDGLGIVGDNTQLRLTGYQLPALLDADATESEIDPGYLINKVTGELMLNHSKSSRLDIQNREKIAQVRLEKAEKDKTGIRFKPAQNVRWVD
uniref:Uncharacterized protein n=1 Tax=viral metagenome TaxID=1070528 RepID=A0A6M3IHX4_9ZZZZ